MKGQRERKLIDRLGDTIVACISGFDRLMLKGCFRSLMYADGAMEFLRRRNVLNKDYKELESSKVEAEENLRHLQSGTPYRVIICLYDHELPLSPTTNVTEDYLDFWGSLPQVDIY